MICLPTRQWPQARRHVAAWPRRLCEVNAPLRQREASWTAERRRSFSGKNSSITLFQCVIDENLNVFITTLLLFITTAWNHLWISQIFAFLTLRLCLFCINKPAQVRISPVSYPSSPGSEARLDENTFLRKKKNVLRSNLVLNQGGVSVLSVLSR